MEQSIEEKVIVEEQETKPNKDNSLIKNMREEMKKKDKELKALKQENETELSKLQKDIQEMKAKEKYGNNFEDAMKLEDAGFDESKIKTMLGSKDTNLEFEDKNKELGLTPRINGETETPKEKTEEQKAEEQMENYKKSLEKETAF